MTARPHAGVDGRNGHLPRISAPSAGDHALKATFSAGGNFSGTAALGSLHIAAAPLTVTVPSVSKTYGSETVAYSVAINGLLSSTMLSRPASTAKVPRPRAASASTTRSWPSPRSGATHLSNYSRDFPHRRRRSHARHAVRERHMDGLRAYGQVAVDGGSIDGIVNDDDITAAFTGDGDAAGAAVGDNYAILATLHDPDGKLDNYNLIVSQATLAVHRARAQIAVQGVSTTYDGGVHGATGSAVNVFGEVLDGLDPGRPASPTRPGGEGHWTFADRTGNYNDAEGFAAIDIAPGRRRSSGRQLQRDLRRPAALGNRDGHRRQR